MVIYFSKNPKILFIIEPIITQKICKILQICISEKSKILILIVLRSTTAKNDGDMPDFPNRNLDSQYWIWWPRESAAKGLNRKTKYHLVKDENNWDGCMNLTLSYRQDSDIVRPFGTIDRVFEEQYFLTDDLRGKELMGNGQK
jgi:hypothetical protein